MDSETRERNLRLFQATPPRLFPHVEYHRPVIDGLLAQQAAVDPGGYEERLEAFNKLCDQYQVARFPRVTVVREVTEPGATVTALPLAPVTGTATADLTVRPKKPKAKAALPPPADGQ